LPALDGVRVLHQDHSGPGVARNLGVAATDRQLILFLGDDMVPRPDLVARHLEHHRANPSSQVAVLGRVVWHASVPDDRLHRWLMWSGALFDFPPDSQVHADAGWARFYSCNVSMKRSLFVDSGGFDPDFVFDYEDLDLGWRLGRQGVRLLYEPRAVAEHLHPYDWPAVVRRYQSRAPAERLMMRKHEWFQPWFYRQMTSAAHDPPVSALWAFLGDHAPAWPQAWREKLRRRADRHYRQRLAPVFLDAWAAADEREGSAGNGSARTS
jgi:GT2 family glycosyltransferase